MLGLGKKSILFLVLAIILGVWISKRNVTKREYWEKLPRFDDVNVDFDTPHPMDQSILYKSVEEIVDPIAGKKSGKIPEWLKGTLLRNGPGLFEFGEEKAAHAFDGMAMIRRYHVEQIRDSKIPEMNISRRLIECETLKENQEQQRYVKFGVGTIPKHTTILDRIKTLGEKTDNMVVNTLKLFGHYYAATEMPQIIEYDPVTLETIGKIDLEPVIPGISDKKNIQAKIISN